VDQHSFDLASLDQHRTVNKSEIPIIAAHRPREITLADRLLEMTPPPPRSLTKREMQEQVLDSMRSRARAWITITATQLRMMYERATGSVTSSI